MTVTILTIDEMVEVIGEYVEFIYCGCGCGFTTNKYYTRNGKIRKRYKTKKFIKGHQGRLLNGDNNGMFGRIGDKHPRWKGNDIGYNKLHEWIRKYLPNPKSCQICGINSKLDAANVSGKYLREINDWLYLCRKCHINYDKNKKILLGSSC